MFRGIFIATDAVVVVVVVVIVVVVDEKRKETPFRVGRCALTFHFLPENGTLFLSSTKPEDDKRLECTYTAMITVKPLDVEDARSRVLFDLVVCSRWIRHG